MSIFDHINKKVFIAGVALFVVLIAGFIFYLSTGAPADTGALTNVDASPLDGTLGRELLTTLARLKSTALDMSVFTDPVFTSLRDFGVEIAPQPVGRRNPFAELGGAGASGKPAVIPGGASKGAASQTQGGAAKKTAPPSPTPPAESSGFDVE